LIVVVALLGISFSVSGTAIVCSFSIFFLFPFPVAFHPSSRAHTMSYYCHRSLFPRYAYYGLRWNDSDTALSTVRTETAIQRRGHGKRR
jgi:hypothetical protein